jgi:hypothetical protein
LRNVRPVDSPIFIAYSVQSLPKGSWM